MFVLDAIKIKYIYILGHGCGTHGYVRQTVIRNRKCIAPKFISIYGHILLF
jgi:hypothetical protein